MQEIICSGCKEVTVLTKLMENAFAGVPFKQAVVAVMQHICFSTLFKMLFPFELCINAFVESRRI